MKALSGRDFVDGLRRAKKDPGDPYVVGMAKLSSDPDEILLGPTHKCGPWTKVPVSAIRRVVPLATCPCREHEHPIVAVYFDDADNPLATALSQLLRNLQAELFREMTTASSGAPTTIARRAGGSGPTGTGPFDPRPGAECFILWLPICWERDFSHDVPPPAARPGVWECANIPILYCWPT
jgi:hypothetical protein